ncbi:PstA family ABC transporter permease [Desulfobotulus sp.]|jgi:phosphate transport system permease protein|uniref:PstA family ABC transporter permease n=1 Tax=Desulfobotulus sp. TaxID=1940337 RepID=UPI002A35CFDC|nr:ABC transporter permease subunit [Desulfobotulus sp.]MDY0161915.1 ABC transporter permease subunit [Desulfobotulus sp.]
MNPISRFLIKAASIFSALSLTALVFFLLSALFIKALPVMDLRLIFGNTPPLEALSGVKPVFDGLFPAICGTLLLVFLAVVLALPLGMAAGIHLALFAGPHTRRWIGVSVDILAGMPSILIGLLGFSVILILYRHFPAITPGLLPAAASLACLILPYLIRGTQQALTTLPPELFRSTLALGASPVQALRHVLLPAARPGLTGCILLSIGRAAEDTAVILLTGTVAAYGLPSGFFDPFEALPFFIYTTAAEYNSPRELAMGFAASLILVGLCGGLFGLAALIRKTFLRNPLTGKA